MNKPAIGGKIVGLATVLSFVVSAVILLYKIITTKWRELVIAI